MFKKINHTLVVLLVFVCVGRGVSQQVDYDDLYFNNADKVILKEKKPAKKQRDSDRVVYNPSEYMHYDYYTSYKSLGKNAVKSLKLDPYFWMPMTVKPWRMYRVKNAHLLRKELYIAYSFVYERRLIEMPFAYMYGVRNEYAINWNNLKVNFYIMQ